MKRKLSIISNIFTFLLTALILVGSYKLLTYTGQNLITTDNTITPIENDESEAKNAYIFYSDANDNPTLYPWNLYQDTTKLSAEQNELEYSMLNLDLLAPSVLYYFEKMTLPITLDYLYLAYNNFDFLEEINFYNIKDDIDIKRTNNGALFFYSTSITLKERSYLLRFAFTDKYQIVSFEMTPIIVPEAIKASINSDKDYLSKYISNSRTNYLPVIYEDIKTTNNLCEFYSIKDFEFTNEFDTLYESDYYDYELEISGNILSYFPKESSYQIVSTDTEILIVMLDKNVILHYDPILDMICGFNMS